MESVNDVDTMHWRLILNTATAVYPSRCPMPGITFESNGRVDLAGSSLLVGVDSYRVVEVVSIDCFPGSPLDPNGRSLLSAELAFLPAERARIEKAIAAADAIAVTIPEPYIVSRDWMTDLVSAAPKPGHVWLNSAETVSDVLTGGLVSRRRDTPPYPTDAYRSDGETQSPRPAERPSPGLTLQIKPEQLRCEGAADTWRVTTMAGHELVVSLLDCYVRAGRYDKVCEVLELAATAADTAMSISLPTPIDSIDWIGSLRPGTIHAGYIWLGDTTLNQILVDRGIASEFPF